MMNDAIQAFFATMPDGFGWTVFAIVFVLFGFLCFDRPINGKI